MKIAVYTIALNEEQFVERWAESCKDADYRLILDTGSTDETIAKATALGITVVSASVRPWRFDDARNISLGLLPADIDYCVALDMDELLAPGWREALEKATATRPRYKYTWSWNGDEPGLQYGGDKIHARHGYRWKHPVHEVIVPDRLEETQEWIDLEIHHHPDASKSRGQYFELLELSTEEDPTDDRNAFYLAREYFFHGMYDMAGMEFTRHLSLPKAVWAPERAASYRYLAKCFKNDAQEFLQAAVATDPGRREPLVDLAFHFYEKEDWAECYEAALDALKISEKPLDYLCEEFAWGYLPYDLAAISAWNMGMKVEAVMYGEKALELAPNDERLARNVSFYKS